MSIGYKIDSSLYRGELVPMGAIENPAPLSMLRLSYPTVCAASSVGNYLWLWDIRTREIIQTISTHDISSVASVDVNETHVFIATHTISIYSRASGERVFWFPDSWFQVLALCAVAPIPTNDESCFFGYELQQYKDPGPPNDAPASPGLITEVHISPSGDDLVALVEDRYVFHISGLKSGATERRQPSWDTPDDKLNLEIPPELHLGSDGFFLENLRVSVAKFSKSIDTLAYDGDRILGHGVSLNLLISLFKPAEDAV